MGGTGRERVGGKVYRLSESFMLNGENLSEYPRILIGPVVTR